MQQFINDSEKTDHRKNVKMQGIDKTIPSGEGLWPFHHKHFAGDRLNLQKDQGGSRNNGS